MADILTASVSVTLSPQGGAGNVPWSEPAKLLPEQHNIRFEQEFNIAANVTDQLISLSQFATISFIHMQVSGGGVLTYKKGATTNTPITCRAIMLETPNTEVISGIYVSTGSVGVTLRLLVLGD